MSQRNFYSSGDMDLTYLEMGIALARIDRMNPGVIPFCVPVLTPTMSQNSAVDNTVIQSNKTNIVSDNPSAIDVSNIDVSNHINIEIPKELCCLPAPVYDIEGEVIIDGAYTLDGGTHSITITGHIDANGNITLNGLEDISGIITLTPTGEPYVYNYTANNGSTSERGTGTIDMNCTITGTESHHTGSGHIVIDGTIVGTIRTTLNDVNRYIEYGSKWLIAFIGGDVSMPRVVCRLPD